MGGMVIYYSIPDRSMGDGRTVYDYNKFHIFFFETNAAVMIQKRKLVVNMLDTE